MAVSDVTMSSEGSSTSRVRQFGLYKTIDSRTAEFLKLSRKRQLRRGCACAAVSTAITVTVVVSALLVFEYGFRTDFKLAPSSLRQINWFQTVNDSKATFNKHNPINNKNSGKLLAIILKALDQKRYLETIVEEYSSQRPSSERTTNYPFQTNVFADRNRRIPTKIYEVYKPATQELFNTRRRDSFVKARKMMDYQRVMSYLNTMPWSKRFGEATPTEVSSTSKPYLTENDRNNILQDTNFQTEKANTREASYNIYCTCPPRSNLTYMLEKLYLSIQQLRLRAIERIPNNTKNRDSHGPNNISTVKVQQSKYYSDQRTSISRKNIQHTTEKIPAKLKTTIFTQYPTATTKNNQIKGTKKTINKQNEKTTNRNEYNTITYTNLDSSYTGETLPWKLDFGITAYDDTSSDYVQNGMKPKNNSTVGKMTESDAMAKYPQNDEQYDEYYSTPPESSQYPKTKPAHEAKTHENKRKTPEEYLANDFYGISKKLIKTLFNTTQPFTDYPTMKPLETKLSSYEIVDPTKIVSTESVEEKERQNISQLITNSNNTAVKSKNSSDSLTKEKDGTLAAKPLTLAAKNGDDKTPLTPMIKSYLLSKDDSGILQLGAGSNSHEVVSQNTNSEELPFNLKFPSNEEDEHVSILSDLNSTKVDTETACDKNKDDINKKYVENKNEPNTNKSRESLGVSKPGKKEKIISLTQQSELMYVSRKPPKSFTEAPNNSGHKKPKIKEIFYMTGGETPVEDFEDNLSALMYYDKSPVNYTALANTYLDKFESDSIEISKSMLPESRPSLLEIRRTHERVDYYYTTHLYTSEEQNEGNAK